MKRILVYGLSKCLGGTESYILTLYRALDKSVLQFDFLFSHQIGEIPYEKEILESGGRIFKNYYRNSEKVPKGAPSIKELFVEHPEWEGIYVNVQKIDLTYRLLVEARKCGLKYRVMHAHNNNYAYKPRVKDKIYELYFHITKKFNITSYLACSELAGNWMFHNKKYIVIPNAVNFEKFKINDIIRKRMRSKFGISESEIVVGFCGRLVYQKNPQLVIEIFKQLSLKLHKCRLLMIGTGEKLEELKKIAKNYGIEKHIFFMGEVLNVEDYMQMMDCFLLPSRYEGFGIVLLEAQAAGLNCFTSKKVVPETTNVTRRVTFIDLDKSVEEWTNIILEKGFERIDCMEQLGKSDYTIEVMKNKIMKIFEVEEHNGN